jgi:hypothetical protein
LAEVCLTVAAAMQAARMPDRTVDRSRVGVFVGIIQRRSWRRVYRYLREAIEAVDGLREQWPLVGEQPQREEVQT